MIESVLSSLFTLENLLWINVGWPAELWLAHCPA